MEKGLNCVIGENSMIPDDVKLGHNVIIEDNVIIGEGSYIDTNSIIRSGTTLGKNSFIGANCIIGEYQMDFCLYRVYHEHALFIGDGALVRSGSIIYTGSKIGTDFQTGHHVILREKSELGDHVSIGTLSDIQGNCRIGSYVRIHSSVFVAPDTSIEDFAWISPRVMLTNDPTPPSDNMKGIVVRSFAVIAASAIILPGLEIDSDSLIAAGAVVTKDVPRYAVVAGNPGKVISDIRKVKNKVTGEPAYPWREHFSNHMPWSESDFETWYNELDIEAKNKLRINHNM